VLDSGSDVEDVAGLAKGRFLLQALVRTVAVHYFTDRRTKILALTC
jgi:hypothetical protein